LVARKQPHAIIESPEQVAAHAVSLARQGIRFAERDVRIDSLCLHGDHPFAVQNARQVRDALQNSGIEVAAL